MQPKKMNRKVKSLQTHIGVQLKNQVVTGIKTDRHGVYMELQPMGVYVQQGDVESIIPYANVVQVILESEAGE